MNAGAPGPLISEKSIDMTDAGQNPCSGTARRFFCERMFARIQGVVDIMRAWKRLTESTERRLPA